MLLPNTALGSPLRSVASGSTRRRTSRLGVRPILFITAENVRQAQAIARHLAESSDYGFVDSEVLAIHTDAQGDVRQRDLDTLRQAARDVDSPESPIRVIVSVLMLREGWDVRNVSVCPRAAPLLRDGAHPSPPSRWPRGSGSCPG